MSNLTPVSLKLLLPLLASIVALSPFAIDLYLPAMPIIANDLNTEFSLVQNTLSIYLLGYALGLILAGPLADKYSRRFMVFFGITGFLLATLLLPFCENITQFLAVRFVQAFVSSAAIVVVPGTVREIYGANTAKGLSYVSMIMMLAPMIAPTIGSVLMFIMDWKLIFWALAFYSFVILMFAVKYLPEKEKVSNKSTQSFLARYIVVLSNAEARLDLLSSMMISLAFFGYITGIAYVYMQVFGVSEFNFSLLFGLTVVALMTSHFTNTRLVVKKGSRKMQGYGLVLAITSASLLVLVTVLELPLFYTVVSILPLMASFSMIAVNTDALVLTKFPEQSGTVTAVIGTLRFGIGAFAGPILSYFNNGTALPFVLLMFVSVLIVVGCQTKVRIGLNKELST